MLPCYRCHYQTLALFIATCSGHRHVFPLNIGLNGKIGINDGLFFTRYRYKNGKKLHELFTTLMTIMSEICQHQFSSLKFGFGPICPIKQCPGISYHGKDLNSNSSSEVSDGELDGNSTCDDWTDDSLALGGREIRPHVICIDPVESSRPLWCNSTPIHEFEAIKEWLITVLIA